MNELSPIAQDSRPQVRARENRLAPWMFAGVATVSALVLFNSLETARQARQDSTEAPADAAVARPLPELMIPAAPAANLDYPMAIGVQPRPAVQLTAMPQAGRPSRQYAPPPPDYTAPVYQPPPYAPPPEPDTAQPPGGFPASFEPPRAYPQVSLGAHTQRIAAPEFTVVEGTLIPAVLETALDSTRAGPVRAIVSRDTRGFDGGRVLVPRGSRLIGEYQADVAPGENRAVISWTRLIRPDGVSIELRAPATDALGRVGVKGRVNNHTFRRLTDTLLQTFVNAGSGFSQRAAPPIIVMPNGGQQPPLLMRDPAAIQPTLTVAQGARVTVFVSQDLDFSPVDGGP